MAYGYRVVDREQPFLLPPDMRDWLPPGHLAWFVIDAVSVLDVSRFAPRATPAGSAAGRAAYDPRMLLALLVLRVCARAAVVAEDRAGVHGGCGVPGDLRAGRP